MTATAATATASAATRARDGLLAGAGFGCGGRRRPPRFLFRLPLFGLRFPAAAHIVIIVVLLARRCRRCCRRRRLLLGDAFVPLGDLAGPALERADPVGLL